MIMQQSWIGERRLIMTGNIKTFDKDLLDEDDIFEECMKIMENKPYAEGLLNKYHRFQKVMMMLIMMMMR